VKSDAWGQHKAKKIGENTWYKQWLRLDEVAY
jgi:hypothetical protein